MAGGAEMHKAADRRQHQVLRELLRQARQESGLRQQDLAERLDEPQSFVSKYESGERRLSMIEVRLICQALEVPFVAFVQRLEDCLKADSGADAI
jgi:transcriptional regulator with XRE-family HTH domain